MVRIAFLIRETILIITREKLSSERLTKVMNLCNKVATALKILYPDCIRVLLASGTHNLSHAHFHLIPITDETTIQTPQIPQYEE